MAGRTKREQRGTTTIFVLGVCIAVLFLGGISLDFWRVISERRALAAIADSSATAGANGLDETRLRHGVLALDPVRARLLAADELTQESQQHHIDSADIAATTADVHVVLQGSVHFSLLSIFLDGDAFVVTVSATAAPHRVS